MTRHRTRHRVYNEPMTTTQNPEAVANSLLASKSDDELFDMLIEAERQRDALSRDDDNRRTLQQVWMMICETIEARHDVDADMEAWVMLDDDDRTYTQALIDIIRAR